MQQRKIAKKLKILKAVSRKAEKQKNRQAEKQKS